MGTWFFDGVARGEIARRERHVVALSDGSDIRLRAVVVRGAHDGPTIYFGAAIHGDEVVGIDVMRRLVRAVKPETLHGALVLVPVQNPPAFYQRQRYLPSHAWDVFAVDISNAFPGGAGMEITQTLAHAVLDGFVQHCQCAVDLHAALAGGVNLEYTYAPAGPEPTVAAARRFARAFGLPMAMEQDEIGEPGSYVGPAKFHQVATLAGVPAFGVELAESGRVVVQSAERGLAGALNLLRIHEVLRDRPYEPPQRQYVAKRPVFVRAAAAGMYVPERPVGTMVRAGERLGTVCSFDFVEESPVHASVDGLLYRSSLHRPVNGAERVASIAVQ